MKTSLSNIYCLTKYLNEISFFFSVRRNCYSPKSAKSLMNIDLSRHSASRFSIPIGCNSSVKISISSNLLVENHVLRKSTILRLRGNPNSSQTAKLVYEFVMFLSSKLFCSTNVGLLLSSTH